jgi:2-keto-4-pentenoate hydratase
MYLQPVANTGGACSAKTRRPRESWPSIRPKEVEMPFERESAILVKAERERTPVGPISDLVPGGLTLKDAHTICEENIQARLEAGERMRGYKVGFTNIPVREDMGLPDSTYGYLLDTMVLESGGQFQMSELIAPKIECEICFLLKAPLSGKGLATEDVLEATEAVRAAFEICDARIKDWECPYPDFFADNGFSARIILGGRGWVSPDEVDLLNEEVVLTREGRELATGKGEAAMGHPANAVSWLAGKLSDRGRSLKAGELVMTGTLTPILSIEAPALYRATFSTLGVVEKQFV